MSQTCIDVVATKRLSVTAQSISTLRNIRRHNRSPIPPAEDVRAVQALNEADVQRPENSFDDRQERVIGVGPCVAALHGPRIALASR